MSIYKAKNGTTYTVDYYSTLGKRVRKAGFKTKAEAEVFERKMLTQRDQGLHVSIDGNKKTVKDFYNLWIELKVNTVTLKTLQNNKEAWKAWVAPKFENIQVGKISPIFIREWLSTLTLKNGNIAGYETQTRALSVLNQILDIAVEAGAIQTNPVRILSSSKQRYLPKPKMKKTDTLTFEQILEISNRAGHYSLFILFLALSGLRQSEAIALKVADLDFEKGIINVSKAFQTIKGRLHLGSTKNNKPRIVHLSSIIKSQLEIHVSSLNKKDFVFTTPKGSIIDMNNFRKRVWKPILDELELSQFAPHGSLRSFFTTESADLGVPLHLVSEADGHSSIDVTLNNYLKKNPARVKQAFEQVDQDLLKRYISHQTSEISKNA